MFVKEVQIACDAVIGYNYLHQQFQVTMPTLLKFCLIVIRLGESTGGLGAGGGGGRGGYVIEITLEFAYSTIANASLVKLLSEHFR